MTETMSKIKNLIKKAGHVIALIFSGIGLGFLFFGKRKNKEKQPESAIAESVKKERREEIEKTDPETLIANSDNAALHSSGKQQLENELDERVDAIVNEFLQGRSSGTCRKDQDGKQNPD